MILKGGGKGGGGGTPGELYEGAKKVRTNKQTHPDSIPGDCESLGLGWVLHLEFSKSSVGDSAISHGCELLPVFLSIAATGSPLKPQLRTW